MVTHVVITMPWPTTILPVAKNVIGCYLGVTIGYPSDANSKNGNNGAQVRQMMVQIKWPG